MPPSYDLSDWRVYSAEESVGYDEPLADIKQCEDVILSVVSSGWWERLFGETAVTVKEGGFDRPDVGLIASFATAVGYPRPSRWEISMHPRMMSSRVLLHELAHCAAPRWIDEDIGPLYRNGHLLANGHRQHRPHGEFFTRTLATITDHALPGDAGELAAALAHFEAPIASPGALQEELTAQPRITDKEEMIQAELQRFLDEHPVVVPKDHPTVPAARPTITWGDRFHMMRRDRHRHFGGKLLSQRRLAELISQVCPCSPRHIAQLDSAPERPTDALQLKRAMLAMIVFGYDPIWVRYSMRLTRWDCGDISLDEARLLNPDWADFVQHLNNLVRERPPRWSVVGAR